MSDKAAFVNSVYSRYRAKPLTLTLFLLLAESEIAFLISPSKKLSLHLSPSDLRSKHILLVIKK